MKKRTATVTFRVTGEFLTRHYRERVVEGECDIALRGLMAGLEGITYEQASAVLNGDLKIIGDSNIGCDVEEDNSEEAGKHKYMLAYTYAGRVKFDELWYRPHSCVEIYGYEDWSSKGCPNPDHIIAVEPYANGYTCSRNICRFTHTGDDKVKIVRVPDAFNEKFNTKTVAIVFEPVCAPPLWLGANYRDAQRSFEEWLDIRRDIDRVGSTNFWDEVERGSALLRRSEAGLGKNEEEWKEEQKRKLAEDEKQEKIRKEKFLAEQVVWKRKIEAQSNREGEDGWIELIIDDDEKGKYKLRVPKIPFIRWSLRRTEYTHILPEWDNICPQGLKLMNDDRDHSDWIVGAGLNLGEFNAYKHDDPINKAAEAKYFEVQKKLCNFRCAVLLDGKRAAGTIVHPTVKTNVKPGSIIILPNGNAKSTDIALAAYQNGAEGIILENGGKLIHLVQVFFDHPIPIVRIPDARKKFKSGKIVTINTKKGTVELL